MSTAVPMRRICSLAAVLCLSQAAAAADSNSPDTSESQTVGLSNSGKSGIDEIVVTAQKREERLKDVPISISVLGGENLDKSSFQGVTEALTTVPGVSAFQNSQGGGTSIAVRGVTASGALFGGPSPIAYYVDGVPFGFVDSAIAPDLSAYDLQRVEVLRGPQGTLYGASALNGVVRVLTQDADLNSFNITARGSDSDTDSGGNNYRGDMAINAPIIPGVLAARAVVDYENLSGWIDKPGEANANDAILRNVRLKVNAKPTENLTIGLSGWLSRQTYGAPSLADNQGNTSHTLAEEISTNYGAYGLKVGYELPLFSVSSTTSYLNYASNDEDDYIDALTIHYPLFEHFGAHVVSEELNFSSSLQNSPWRWAAGAIYREAQNATYQTLPQIVTLDWTDTSRSYALFGEISRRFLDGKMEATIGGRYFHDKVSTREDPAVAPINTTQYYASDASFNSTTPRAVLSWFPTKDGTLYTSFSEGFRSGAPAAYYVVGGVQGFPAVKPDKLYNYEVGWKQDLLDRRVSFDTAVYYMDWRDVQQQLIVPFGVSQVAAIVNGQTASGFGFDLGITTRPFEGLDLGINYSWNDLTVDSDVFSGGKLLIPKGDRLNFSAKQTAAVTGGYTVPFGSSGYTTRLFASGNYSAPLLNRAIVGSTVAAGDGNSMIIVRAGLSLQAPANWNVTVFADNLTNDAGVIYRNPINPVAPAVPSERVRPRTVGLQFDYRYK